MYLFSLQNIKLVTVKRFYEKKFKIITQGIRLATQWEIRSFPSLFHDWFGMYQSSILICEVDVKKIAEADSAILK